jgi:hypothetical protein
MYAGLGGVVVNVLLQPDDDHTRHRPDIDDRSPASLDHPPAERACAPENGVQVDVYDFALFGVGRLRGGGLTPNAGVVDEDVDRAETIGQSRDCVRIRDVDLLERDISRRVRVSSMLDWLQSTTTTRAPASSSASTQAAPIPLAPPVTTAVLPSSRDFSRYMQEPFLIRLQEIEG